MTFIQHYDSPLGGILLAADEIGLTGLWFDGQKYFARGLSPEREERELPVLLEAKRWLDIYFTGKEPDFLPPLHPVGSAFRQLVWELLLQVPYGKTTTYGEIACKLAEKQKLLRRPKQLAVLWDIIPSPSSFPATGSSARTGVSRATPGALTKR